MQLVFLLLLLIVPYAFLAIAGRWRVDFRTTPAFRARLGLSLFFAFTASGHFIRTEEMTAMLPPVVSHPYEIIYATPLYAPIPAWRFPLGDAK